MVTLRRFLVLCALLFWQGGFTFYAAVVVPIGRHVLRSQIHLQAQITDLATNVLNLSGVVALLFLLWDLITAVDPHRLRRQLRVGAWVVLALTLAGLFAVHQWMDVLHPPESTESADARFHTAHGLYLCIHTAQWLTGFFFLYLSLLAWRGADGSATRKEIGARGDAGEKEEGRG